MIVTPVQCHRLFCQRGELPLWQLVCNLKPRQQHGKAGEPLEVFEVIGVSRERRIRSSRLR